MAQIEEQGKGRGVNVEVNLVPIIDLMSVLIIFLLITAVWSQVSMIQLGASVYGQKTQDEPTPPPPRVEVPLRIDVKPEGFRLLVGNQMQSFPKVNGEYDKEKLILALKKVKETYPDKVDAVLTINDELKYEYLIAGMDACLQGGFPEVSIAASGVQ